MKKRRINPEKELRFFFAGHKHVSMTPHKPRSYEPHGLEIGLDGWETKCPDGAYTLDDLRDIEAALQCLEPTDVAVLREHHSDTPKGTLEGLEDTFDIWTKLVHRSPLARRLSESEDPTEVRKTLRHIVRLSQKSKERNLRWNAHTILRHVRHEALELYIRSRDRYEAARKLLKDKGRHH